MNDKDEIIEAVSDEPSASLETVIEIHDPEIDVEAIMTQIRENIAQRKAEGAYQEDVDAIADEVFAEVMAMPITDIDGAPAVQGLDATLAELNARWVIREVPFSSSIPVLGKVIVAVRNFWNWMSTKWYVRALLQQQVEFNALVVQSFNQMRLENQVLSEDLAKLQALVDHQRGEIEVLDKKLARLQTTDVAQQQL